MPMRLNVGVSRKIGLPDYGSAGASCNLEVELDASSLDDLDAFHQRVRAAYLAARRAVTDELARQHDPAGPEPASTPSRREDHAGGHAGRNGHATTQTTRNDTAGRNGHATTRLARNDINPDRPAATRRGPRTPATPRQLAAIRALARRAGTDLAGLLQGEFGLDHPDGLSLTEASRLIDRLKADLEPDA